MDVKTFLSQPIEKSFKELSFSMQTNYIPYELGQFKGFFLVDMLKKLNWKDLDKNTRIQCIQHFFNTYFFTLQSDQAIIFSKESYSGVGAYIFFSQDYYFSIAGFGKPHLLENKKTEICFYTPPTFKETDWSKGVVEVTYWALSLSSSSYVVSQVHCLISDENIKISKGNTWNIRKLIPSRNQAKQAFSSKLVSQSIESDEDGLPLGNAGLLAGLRISPKNESPSDLKVLNDKIDWNSDKFNVENEEIVTGRTLSSIPTMYSKPKESKKQRRLILKYFENDERYAKIIPRTISFIYQMRTRFAQDDDLDKEEIEGFHLIQLVKTDDPKLEEMNPIVDVLYFDELENIFKSVGDQVFYFTKQEETIITLFLQRKMKYFEIEEYTKEFDGFQESQKFARALNSDEILALRYYDSHHHGYTLIELEKELPIYRTGSNAVKLLIQSHKVKKQMDHDDVTVNIPLDLSNCVMEKKKMVCEATNLVESSLLKVRFCADSKEVRSVILSHFKDFRSSYASDFKKCFETYYKTQDLTYEKVKPKFFPDFGGEINNDLLTEEGSDMVKRILCVLSIMNQRLEYCPYLANVVALLLIFLNEEETYGIVTEMIKQGKFFRLNKNSYEIMVRAFLAIFEANFPKIKVFLEQKKYSILQAVSECIGSFFCQTFAMTSLIKILTSFVKHGITEFYRIIFSILKTNHNEILNMKTSFEIHKFFLKPSMTFETLFGLKLNVNLEELEKRVPPPTNTESNYSPYSRPRIADRSIIIDDQANSEQFYEFLWTIIPFRLRIRKLTKIFSSDKDGYSIGTLFRKVKDSESILMLFSVYSGTNKTMEELELSKNHSKPAETAVIGCFLGESISPSYSYEGTTDSLVFTMQPTMNSYKWSRKNDFFVLGKNESISIGGGGRGPAIHIDQEMGNGSSQQSQTFDNPPLCLDFIWFKVSKFEAFTFE